MGELATIGFRLMVFIFSFIFAHTILNFVFAHISSFILIVLHEHNDVKLIVLCPVVGNLLVHSDV